MPLFPPAGQAREDALGTLEIEHAALAERLAAAGAARSDAAESADRMEARSLEREPSSTDVSERLLGALKQLEKSRGGAGG